MDRAQILGLFDSDPASDPLAISIGCDPGCELTWFEELAFHIADYPDGTDLLFHTIGTVDEVRLTAAISALSSSSANSERLRPIVERLLSDPRPMVLAQAVSGARHLQYADLYTVIRPLVGHPDRYVVGAALSYMAALFPDEAKPLLIEALSSQDSILIQYGIDELGDAQATDAIPLIRKLLDHPEEYVRQAAETAVRDLEYLLESEDDDDATE